MECEHLVTGCLYSPVCIFGLENKLIFSNILFTAICLLTSCIFLNITENDLSFCFLLLVSYLLGCEETEEADIYFLIDGSGSIFPDSFHDMRVFMTEMINMFQVGANRVRFGVVQYGSTPVTEFLIDEYNTVEQLKRAIKAIQQIGGGTRTGDALRYMQSLFKAATRDKVPQFLIIITDGESQDQVTKAAEELRERGIVIYAIGVKDAVKKELEDIAGTKDQMFFVNDFDSLKLIKHDIVRDICSPEGKNLGILKL